MNDRLRPAPRASLPARSCVRPHPSFGILLVLSLCTRCTPTTWHVDADRAVVAAISESGQVRFAQLVDGRSEFEQSEFESLVAFPVPDETFVSTTGGILDWSEISAGVVGDFPPGSCKTCRAGGSGPPMPIGRGDTCPLPQGLPAPQILDDFVHPPGVLDRVRERLTLSSILPCDAPPLSAPSTAESNVTFCPVSPSGAAIDARALAISGSGAILGLAAAQGILIDDRGTHTLSLENGLPVAPVPIGETDFVFALRHAEDEANFYRLRGQDRVVERISAGPAYPAGGLALPSGEILLFGRAANEGAQVFGCHSDPLECTMVGLPSAGLEGCSFLSAGSSLEDAALLPGGTVALRYRKPSGFVYLGPDGTSACTPAEFGDDGGWILENMVVSRDTVFATAYDEDVSGRVLVRADVRNDRVGRFEVLRNLSASSRFVTLTDSVWLISSREAYELGLDGQERRRVPASEATLPGMLYGVDAVVTSTRGRRAATDQLGRIYRDSGDGSFRVVYQSSESGPENMNAIARLGDQCLALLPGALWSFSEPAASCAGESVTMRKSAELAFEGTATAGFEWEDRSGFVVDLGGGTWSIRMLEGLRLRELGRISGGEDGASVLAVEPISPDSLVLAFSDGRVTRVFEDGESVTRDLRGPLKAAAISGGVVWAGGQEVLYRLTPNQTELVVDDWTDELRGMPFDFPVVRTVSSIAALSADYVLVGVEETSIRADDRANQTILFEIHPGYPGPTLVNPRRSDALAQLRSDNVYFAGSRSRFTAAAGRVVVRGGSRFESPTLASNLTDCGDFMILGGSTRHAVAVLDGP